MEAKGMDNSNPRFNFLHQRIFEKGPALATKLDPLPSLKHG